MKNFIKLIIILVLSVLFFVGCKKNGFVKEGEQTFYYVNGEKKSGWKENKGNWYYFGRLLPRKGKNGKPIQEPEMLKEYWLIDGKKKYYFDESGKMLKSILTNKTKKRSFFESGRISITDPIEDYRLYYFDENGEMLFDIQKEINGETYNFDSDGVATRVPGTRTLTLFGHYKIIENKWTEISDEKEIILTGNKGRKCKLTNFTRSYPWEWNCNIEFLGNEEINRYTTLPFAFVSDEFYSFGEMHFEWVNRISDREFKISATKYSIDDKDRNFIIEFMY